MLALEASARPSAAPTERRVRPGVVLVLTCIAQAMVSLDIAIVNVALPSIQRELAVSQSALQWIVVAYGLLLGGFLLLGGKLADVVGRRRILVAGLAVFTTASLLAGVAPSGGILIGARGLQGFGAALIAPAALSLVAVNFAEGSERNRALGIFGAVGGASGSLGVVASGLLADGPGWRWVFFINVPVGVALIALAGAVLTHDRAVADRRHLDVAGAVTATGGLLLLVYSLNSGAEHGWTAAPTLLTAAAAVFVLIAFVRIERRVRVPLVPGTALRNRTLVAANITALCTFGAFFSFIFIGSLLMQQVLGYSPTRTGVSWLATSGTAFVASAITGVRLAATVGVRRLLIIGLALLAVGVLLLVRVPADAAYVVDLLPGFLLAGTGLGLCAPSLQIGALTGASESESGLASGLIETMREIGGAAGVAAVTTMLVSRAGLAGFHAGFAVIAALAVVGAVGAAVLFTRDRRTAPHLGGDVATPVDVVDILDDIDDIDDIEDIENFAELDISELAGNDTMIASRATAAAAESSPREAE